MDDDKILEIARAAFAEASKPTYDLWFSGLQWDGLDQLHRVFLACTNVVLAKCAAEIRRPITEALKDGQSVLIIHGDGVRFSHWSATEKAWVESCEPSADVSECLVLAPQPELWVDTSKLVLFFGVKDKN